MQAPCYGFICIATSFYLFIALGQLPPCGSVPAMRLLHESVTSGPSDIATPDDCISIGAGLPPVPSKLVSKIEAGEFIDMAELLPDRLGVARAVGNEESAGRVAKQKRRVVSNIMEWVQCFGVYLAVISRKQPLRIPDLLGYQTLIIEAYLEYEGDGWMGYDRRFRQRAPANPGQPWACIDTTLWNLAFAAKARASRCQHCFSLSHVSSQCDWAPEPSPQSLMLRPPTSGQQKATFICRAWNNDPRQGCPVAYCTYRHICFYCRSDTHKGVFCPNRSVRSQQSQSFTKTLGPYRQ